VKGVGSGDKVSKEGEEGIFLRESERMGISILQ
jgi:hypothetical protein